jgi:hypothetical protein
MHARRVSKCLLLGVLAMGAPASAGPVLHEYFEATPEEDLEQAATTPDGALPAALETESGVVPAPQLTSEPTTARHAYGGGSTPNSTDSTYRIDRNTTRPSMVSYDDPFTPPITPFKRLFAYDGVNDSLELIVRDKALVAVPQGGQANDGEDQFYADLNVDLAKGTPVRIPSVGPHTRILKAQLDPPLDFELLRDGAENWFIRADRRIRARLVMQLSTPRSVFGSPFANTNYDALKPALAPLPEPLALEASLVLEQLALTPLLTPAEAVERLVGHFRNFRPSNELPQARDPVALYAELATSQKGVCRHRGYAFMITALAMGIPTRFVRNEAHAWVEVFDGRLWHRIDLGGAANQLQAEQDTRVAPHRTPDDPYAWPAGSESESGSGMAERAGSGSTTSDASSASDRSPKDQFSRQTSKDSSVPSASLSDDVSTPEPQASTADDFRPRATLSFRLAHTSARRGTPLELSGSVRADDEPCGFSRIDVALQTDETSRVFIGALPSDEQGNFHGQVTIPLSVDVGDYSVSVSTPGTASCAPSD